MTVTNRDLLFKIEDELKEVSGSIGRHINTSFVLEPFGRNTAPAVAAATILASKKYGDDVILLVLTADHLVEDKDSLASAVNEACVLAKTGKIVTFGIQPTSPETGYGYIESNGHDIIRFVEKPSLEKAKQYIESGTFLWNSGMFCFTAKVMLQEMELHCPEILRATKNCIREATVLSGSKTTQIEISSECFETVPDNSIDYAVMEKTANAAVVACDIGWSDIGCWQALGNLTTADENHNRIKGDVLVYDSRNCTVESANRVVGIVGVDNLIVIDTPDALLVVDKAQAQKVKQVYSRLKALGHDAHKHHLTAQRPWGSYTVLEHGSDFKIKRIVVNAGAKLSLQMHYYRSEHWVVVQGSAKILNGEVELTLAINESTFIPAMHKHRLENIGTEELVIIEVQTGSYLGEDDIVRFADIYGRAECSH
jgi:mannose-1-phosphate guanylyltransferase